MAILRHWTRGGIILKISGRAAHKGGRHFPRKTEDLLSLIGFVEFALIFPVNQGKKTMFSGPKDRLEMAKAP